MQIDVNLYQSRPPMPIAKNVPGPACNYREDRDPVFEDTGSESDDDRTLADILKRKESSSDPVGDSPSPGQSSPKSHLKGSRPVVLKRKASSLGDAK